MGTHLQNAFCKVWADLYFHHQHSSTSLSLWLHLLVGITIKKKKLVSFVCKNSTSLWFYFTVLIVMVNILTKLFISNFSFVNCLQVAFMIYIKGCFVGRTYKTTVKIILYWNTFTNHPSHVIRIYLPDTGHNAVLSPDAYSSSNRSQNHKDSRQELFPEDCKHKLG